ncbi:MAG: hypothetical protein WBO09_16920 [Methylocystis silviterrae]|uniref:hypothetical protein n=1 Tax=Methylocystis silviterrae TaxID=2743612 RepID=UPI003C73FB73
MKEQVSKSPSASDNDHKSKTKRPYRAPTIESYGSVSGITRFIGGNYKGADTILYSY